MVYGAEVHGAFSFPVSDAVQLYHGLNVPWDGSMNKMAHIFAEATTVDVKHVSVVDYRVEAAAMPV